MVQLLMMVMVAGAGVLAVWTMVATLGSRLDLIVTLLRDGPQPFAPPQGPAPVRLTPRPVMRGDARVPLVRPAWREAA